MPVLSVLPLMVRAGSTVAFSGVDNSLYLVRNFCLNAGSSSRPCCIQGAYRSPGNCRLTRDRTSRYSGWNSVRKRSTIRGALAALTAKSAVRLFPRSVPGQSPEPPPVFCLLPPVRGISILPIINLISLSNHLVYTGAIGRLPEETTYCSPIQTTSLPFRHRSAYFVDHSSER